jgi:hypothetical protein
MIKYIKREDLDIEKYDDCIKNSSNSRIYAYSFYLDIVASSWDALVLNEYETVMPITWNSKYFIKYIYSPAWTQQLGVFSSNTISNELIEKFIKAIPKKYFKTLTNFNSGNSCSNLFDEKTNYILPLNTSYKELFKKFKYIRRRVKLQFDSSKFLISSTDECAEVIQLFVEQKQEEVSVKHVDYVRLEKLVSFLQTLNKVDIIVAKAPNGELLGGAIFLKDDNRITYLFSSISQIGRDKQVMTFIIDSVIEKYSNSNFILDFEGSMIPGVAFFFKSFGAIKETYFKYQKSLFS